MKIFVSLIIVLVLSAALCAETIYQIQYTTTPGTGSTYPSPLVNTVVTTQGIVTATGFAGGKYVIADNTGAWNSIFISDPANAPQIGDRISVTGTVIETGGFTEIGTVTDYQLLDSNNILPAATEVNPADMAGYPSYPGEAYEGVLVKLTDIKVTLVYNSDIFYVALVTGAATTCQINDGFFPAGHDWAGVIVNQVWSSITGIVYYSSPNPPQYRINPRNDADMVPTADINTISLKLDDIEVEKGRTVTINTTISKTEESWNLTGYRFAFSYNPRIARFVDAEIDGTLSDTYPDIEISQDEEDITIIYQSDNPIVSPNNNGLLLKLTFDTISYGLTDLDLTSARFYGSEGDSVNANILTDGSIKVEISKRIAWLSVFRDDMDKRNIFNPWLNEKLTLEFGSLMVPGVASCKAILRIYDIQGRLVATPFNGLIDVETVSGYSTATGLRTILWDGRDRNRNLLPIGVYYCHLEIIDRTDGHSETTIQPIVIAAELK